MVNLFNALIYLDTNFIFQEELLLAFQATFMILQASRELKAQSALQKIISFNAFRACILLLIKDNAILNGNLEAYIFSVSLLVKILSLMALRTQHKFVL